MSIDQIGRVSLLSILVHRRRMSHVHKLTTVCEQEGGVISAHFREVSKKNPHHFLPFFASPLTSKIFGTSLCSSMAASPRSS